MQRAIEISRREVPYAKLFGVSSKHLQSLPHVYYNVAIDVMYFLLDTDTTRTELVLVAEPVRVVVCRRDVPPAGAVPRDRQASVSFGITVQQGHELPAEQCTSIPTLINALKQLTLRTGTRDAITTLKSNGTALAKLADACQSLGAGDNYETLKQKHQLRSMFAELARNMDDLDRVFELADGLTDDEDSDYAPPVSALVKQTGTKQLEVAMQWKPEIILAFPDKHGEFDDALIDDNTSLPRQALARLHERVIAVILCDPTETAPWHAMELLAFQKAVVAAAKELVAGKKVLFLCDTGKNRSRAAAIAAVRIAKLDATDLRLPKDKSLMPVVECVVADDAAGLAALAPLVFRREKRKR